MSNNHVSRFSWMLLLVVLITLPGCDLLGDDDEDDPITTGVYVANQGSFTEGTGTVTVYEPQSEDVSPHAISNLSSTVQSITITDDRLYVMANSANYVNVYTLDNFTQVAQHETPGPRYMAVASDGKAYVTNQLYSRSSMVSVLDLDTDTVVDSITVDGSPDGITVVGDRAYVAEGAFGMATTLAIIDTETDEVTERVDADCDSPRSVFADEEDEVWVVCTGVATYDDEGNPTGQTNGAIRVLDGATGEIIRRIAVDSQLGGSGPGQDVFYSARAEEAYVVKGGNQLIRLNTAANDRAATLGPFDGDAIGAVGYDALSQRLYVGHVPGFGEERGTVTIHDRSGDQTGGFTVGVAPAYITFRQAE